MSDEIRTPLWSRAVADQVFRERLIEDPLRALADAGNVAVSAKQVRQLEELDVAEREALVTQIVREVHARGAVARFGTIGPDGRFGGW